MFSLCRQKLIDLPRAFFMWSEKRRSYTLSFSERVWRTLISRRCQTLNLKTFTDAKTHATSKPTTQALPRGFGGKNKWKRLVHPCEASIKAQAQDRYDTSTRKRKFFSQAQSQIHTKRVVPSPTQAVNKDGGGDRWSSFPDCRRMVLVLMFAPHVWLTSGHSFYLSPRIS